MQWMHTGTILVFWWVWCQVDYVRIQGVGFAASLRADDDYELHSSNHLPALPRRLT